MNFHQFLSVIRARWKLSAGVFVGVFALAVLVTLLMPKMYAAEGSVLLDIKSPDPINGMIFQSAGASTYIQTQVDVIQSERVGQRVVEMLKLDQSPMMQSQWQEQSGGVGSFKSWMAALLTKKLEVVPSRDSSVVYIKYTAADPYFSAAVTNAFIQAYIDTTLELRVEPAKRYSSLFDEQAKAAREKLERAQTKLSAFQREKGIIATDERFDVENSRLAELSSQLVAIQAVNSESRNKERQAGSNSPEVLGSAVVASLRADLSRQEARLDELSARYGKAHPSVMELEANVATLRSKIDAESVRVKASTGVTSTVNRARESEIKAAYEAQRASVLKAKSLRDEAAVLLKDVELAQRNYDAVEARYTQSNLESQSNQTNVSLLKLASPPLDPSSPRVVLNTVIGFLLAVMLGLGVTVIREIADRRLRTEEDLSVFSIPVLGNMPSVDLKSTVGAALPSLGSGAFKKLGFSGSK